MKKFLASLGFAGILAVGGVVADASPAKVEAFSSPINLRLEGGGYNSFYAQYAADRGPWNGSYTHFRARVHCTNGGYYYGPIVHVEYGTARSRAVCPYPYRVDGWTIQLF